MFTNLDEFVQGQTTLEYDASGQFSSRELHICTAALMLHIAYADEELDENEVSMLFKALETKFSLREEQAGDVAEVAKFLAKDRSKLGSIVDSINTHFSHEQKETIAKWLFKIMMSDGIAHRDEAKLITEIGRRLELDPTQLVHARKLAESE